MLKFCQKKLHLFQSFELALLILPALHFDLLQQRSLQPSSGQASQVARYPHCRKSYVEGKGVEESSIEVFCVDSMF